MRTLMVNYDLNRPGQRYPELISALENYPLWWHHLDSTWLVRTDQTPAVARDHLGQFIDSGDEILVIDVTGDAAAWRGFSSRGSQWLSDNL